MPAKTTASRKAKGRKAQQQVVKQILDTFPQLTEADCTSRSMGAQGTDVLLSQTARSVFPFAVEVKCQETLNIWAALSQATENSEPNLHPLLVFKRNKTPLYACLDFKTFLQLLKDKTNG